VFDTMRDFDMKSSKAALPQGSVSESVPEAGSETASASAYRDRSSAENQISPLEEELLSVLLGRELYGLQICEAFEQVSNGKRRMSVGTLYPVLARLEQKGLVTSRMASRPTDSKGGARRKYFQITRRGSHALADADDFRKHLSAWQPMQV
jgi:PadR family transcriptional regulator, regulatory protein PadR